MLVVAAIMLLTRLVVGTRTVAMDHQAALDLSNYRIHAVGVGSYVMNEIALKSFDEKTKGQSAVVISSSEFTSADSLGIETGEDVTNKDTFDDIDDYKNYVGMDTSYIPYTYFVKVEYVDLDTLQSPWEIVSANNNRTFYKRINIDVYSPYLKDEYSKSTLGDTLHFSRVQSYF